MSEPSLHEFSDEHGDDLIVHVESYSAPRPAWCPECCLRTAFDVDLALTHSGRITATTTVSACECGWRSRG